MFGGLFTFGWTYPLYFNQFFIIYNFITPKSESYFRFKDDKSSQSVVSLLFLLGWQNIHFCSDPECLTNTRRCSTMNHAAAEFRSFFTKLPRLLLQRFKNAYWKCLFMTGIWRCIWVHPGKIWTKVLLHLLTWFALSSRGRSQEWHSRVSGRLLASGLLAIRDTFRPEHKETKIWAAVQIMRRTRSRTLGQTTASFFFSEDFLTSSSNPGGPGAQRAGKVTSDGFPRTARVSLAPSSSFSRCVPSLFFFFFFVGRPCRFCQQHLGAPRCVCYASHSSSQKNANCGELWTKGRFDGGWKDGATFNRGGKKKVEMETSGRRRGKSVQPEICFQQEKRDSSPQNQTYSAFIHLDSSGVSFLLSNTTELTLHINNKHVFHNKSPLLLGYFKDVCMKQK